MSSSFTALKSRGYWCQDSILEIWLRLMALNLPPPSEAAWMAPLRDEWFLQSSGSFCGCISAQLDQFLDSSEKGTLIIAAADKVVKNASDCGELISPQMLNLLGIGGRFESKLETAFLSEVHAVFVRLLQGKLDWTQATSPKLPTNAWRQIP